MLQPYTAKHSNITYTNAGNAALVAVGITEVNITTPHRVLGLGSATLVAVGSPR